jgi:hypothetical protein
MNETKAYLLSGADDNAYEHMPTERVNREREMIAKVAEYERLQAALARLQQVGDTVTIDLLGGSFLVAASRDGEVRWASFEPLLVEACEFVVAMYDGVAK